MAWGVRAGTERDTASDFMLAAPQA